jgi:hypothetical protein
MQVTYLGPIRIWNFLFLNRGFGAGSYRVLCAQLGGGVVVLWYLSERYFRQHGREEAGNSLGSLQRYCGNILLTVCVIHITNGVCDGWKGTHLNEEWPFFIFLVRVESCLKRVGLL